MPRVARPSDLYRLPAPPQAPEPEAGAPDATEPEPPQPRGATLLGRKALAVIAVVGLIAAVAVRPPPPPPAEVAPEAPGPPVVASATRTALSLHAAERDAVRNVAANDDRLDPVSLGAASALLRGDADHVDRHLRESRELRGDGGPLLAGYAADEGHDLLVRRLRRGEALTRDLSLLQVMHDRTLAGARGLSANEPGERLGELVGGARTDPVAQWARNLLGARGGGSGDPRPGAESADRARYVTGATQARIDALQVWHNHAQLLRQPAGVQALRGYLMSLPPEEVGRLRAHPRIGPRLADLLPPDWPPAAAAASSAARPGGVLPD